MSEVVMLSHPIWQRRYGGDPAIVGRRIELNAVPRTVVGILPADFRLPIDFNTQEPFDVYVPFGIAEGVEPLPNNGGSHSYYGVARLREGASVESAQAEALAWNQRMTADGIYHEDRRFRTLVIPAVDDVVGDVRPALSILLFAVGLVLLIACSNVANLVLSRGQERRRELALRTALGAGSGRVFRQLMTESLVLAVSGGVLAVALAYVALNALLALEPGSLPRLAEVRLDSNVLLFAALATLVTAVLFGVVPAISASRTKLRESLAQGSQRSGSGLGSTRFRGALVALQMALAVVLVVGAMLMIRTFANLLQIDPGFRSENVLTMRLSTPSSSYPESEDTVAFFEQLLTEVRAPAGSGIGGRRSQSAARGPNRRLGDPD